MTVKTALITGVTGQDGAYLARLLLDKGYQVFGAYRRTSSLNLWRLDELGVKENEQFRLLPFDLTDLGSCLRLIEASEPDELYNLAAQSFVGMSFDQPVLTSETTGIGALNLLEAIRINKPATKFYQASTAEMFGKAQTVPQVESTPFYPRSPYGIAKLYAHWMTIHYREAYNIFGASGILFNHESPLRGSEFVTRKITESVARIKLGHQDCLELGNLDVKRDWGFAGDYVDGMHRMLQTEEPDTFVLATNVTESVRHFVGLACAVAEIPIAWEGGGADELAVRTDTGKTIVRIDPQYFRPTEVDYLIGDPAKASSVLGWEPKVNLQQLCEMMVLADLRRTAAKH